MEKESKIDFAIRQTENKIQQLGIDIMLLQRERETLIKSKLDLEAVRFNENIG